MLKSETSVRNEEKNGKPPRVYINYGCVNAGTGFNPPDVKANAED